MQEGLVTALLWLLFGGSHVVLSIRSIRARMVARFGEVGFVFVYSLVAIGTFAALVRYVALHRFAEPQASLLVTIPPVRGALIALSVIGFSLFVAAVLIYPGFQWRRFAIASCLRAGFNKSPGIRSSRASPFGPPPMHCFRRRRVTFVFFIGVIVLSFVGGMHQDRRLMAKLGDPYRAYVASTSFWPFVAAITKRQTINWREQPWFALGVGIGASLGLYEVHDHIFDHGGAYVIAAVTLGSILAIVNSRARAQRPRKEA